MTFALLVDTSRRVAETRGRRAKIALLAELLRTLSPEELEIGVAYLSGMVLQAKLGVGWATIQAALPGSAAEGPGVTLTEVDETLGRIVQASGPGSVAERQRLLALRADGTIGDAAFQQIEQALDLEELDLQQLAPGADSGGTS